MKIQGILILFLISFALTTHQEAKDLFGDLYKGKVYSGFLDTDIEKNKLFFIYTPSQDENPDAPVLLWLNGGPGCSSLFGWLAEIGPVVTNLYSGKWMLNEYAWNKKVSTLFIESPAGVGFSTTDDPEHEWKDEETAKSMNVALKNFFQKEFPELAKKDFYVSGESYAGVYIPFLIKEIVKDTTPEKLNLKGALIANGMTLFETDYERSGVEFAYWHAMISSELFNAFEYHCPHLDPEVNDFRPRNVTHKCNEIRAEIQKHYGGVDIYGIYRPCRPKTEEEKSNPSLREKYSYKNRIMNTLKKASRNYNGYGDEDEEEVDVFDAVCQDDFTIDDFLNDNETRKKLGLNTTMLWTQCSPVNYPEMDSYDFYVNVLPTMTDFRLWFFSGDTDGIIPTLGSVRWIDKLGFKETEKYRQWRSDKQVSGFIQKFEHNFTFVTVKGAGHMAPMDNRKDTYYMLDGFIFKNDL